MGNSEVLKPPIVGNIATVDKDEISANQPSVSS